MAQKVNDPAFSLCGSGLTPGPERVLPHGMGGAKKKKKEREREK